MLLTYTNQHIKLQLAVPLGILRAHSGDSTEGTGGGETDTFAGRADINDETPARGPHRSNLHQPTQLTPQLTLWYCLPLGKVVQLQGYTYLQPLSTCNLLQLSLPFGTACAARYGTAADCCAPLPSSDQATLSHPRRQRPSRAQWMILPCERSERRAQQGGTAG